MYLKKKNIPTRMKVTAEHLFTGKWTEYEEICLHRVFNFLFFSIIFYNTFLPLRTSYRSLINETVATLKSILTAIFTTYDL